VSSQPRNLAVQSATIRGGSIVRDFETLTLQARRVRRQVVDALHAAGGGHFGGSLSVVDILIALYGGILPAVPDRSHGRDRVILSKGHAAMTLYAVLAGNGSLPPELLADYGKFGRGLEGHPDMEVTPGVDFSTGSLGQGVAVGIGMALALQPTGAHVWVVVGDGECQEGEIWEAALLGPRCRLDNLHVIIDENGAQEFGWKYRTDLDPVPVRHLADKWRAFGWQVGEVDGHDLPALVSLFEAMRGGGGGSPSVAVARTRKGRGCALFEAEPERYHCARLTEDEYQRALSEVTWSSD
jgi:transketolase